MTSKTPKKRRARTKTGHYRADDPSTPDVNEAWEIVEEKKVAPKEEKAAPAPKSDSSVVWFETREAEASMFPVAGVSPVRNFTTRRLEYKVAADDVDRFVQNHFVMNGRVVRKS